MKGEYTGLDGGDGDLGWLKGQHDTDNKKGPKHRNKTVRGRVKGRVCGRRPGRVGVPQTQAPINRVPLNGHDSRRTKVTKGEERTSDKNPVFSFRYLAHVIQRVIIHTPLSSF